jgi:hypothetical protein
MSISPNLVRRTHEREETMKFMQIVKGRESNVPPPPPSLGAAIEELAEEAMKSGALLARGGLLPSAEGASIRMSNGRVELKDGPFTEAREVIGGFAIYEVESKEKAVEMAMGFMKLCKEHWPEWEGEVEIRPMFGFGSSAVTD